MKEAVEKGLYEVDKYEEEMGGDEAGGEGSLYAVALHHRSATLHQIR